MVDVGALFDRATTLASGVIRASGTTVRIETRETVTAPGTLDQVETVTVLATVPALITAAGSVNSAPVTVPGVELRPGDLRVLVEPSVTAPEPGTFVVVTACRDANLRGTVGKVLGTVADSAGAVLRIFVRPT